MINRTISSDLAPTFRHTDFGYFAPVPVLADTKPTNVNASGLIECGVARESTYKNRTVSGGSVGCQNSRSPDSRGGRIQFKGRGGGRW